MKSAQGPELGPHIVTKHLTLFVQSLAHKNASRVQQLGDSYSRNFACKRADRSAQAPVATSFEKKSSTNRTAAPTPSSARSASPMVAAPSMSPESVVASVPETPPARHQRSQRTRREDLRSAVLIHTRSQATPERCRTARQIPFHAGPRMIDTTLLQTSIFTACPRIRPGDRPLKYRCPAVQPRLPARTDTEQERDERKRRQPGPER